MSLAFDKAGKPFTFQRRTKKLLVRLFRNPSARGTCCQVLGVDGQPLYVDPETDYIEFRKAVGQVPGLYRLDQCDDDGNELEDAPAAYVSIDTARNAVNTDSAAGDVNPLLIIQQLVALHADVMKTMVANHASMLSASAEMMRAPYRPAPVAMPAPELRNADSHDDDDEIEEDDESEEEAVPQHPAALALSMLEPHLPDLGAFAYEKCVEFLRHVYGKKNATSPAATPAPTPASVPATAAAPQPTGEPMDVAAGWSPPPATHSSAAPSVTEADTGADDDSESDAGAPMEVAPDPTSMPSDVAPTTSTIATATDAAPIPTREQLAHLLAIRQQLTPKEQAIAQTVITRMNPPMLSHWLAELSAMSVEDATALIRKMAAEVPSSRGSKRR